MEVMSHYSMIRKPRVLLVPDVSVWILGEIARQIIRQFGDRYEFYYLSDIVLRRRPDLQVRMLRGVDFVHALTQFSARLLSQVPLAKRPPMVTWIHHIVDWTAAHQTAVDNSQVVIAVTDSWAQEIRSRAEKPVRCQVVPLGIDIQRFRRVPPSRQLFRIPGEAFAIGFVGSNTRGNHYRKGVDTFLRVVKRLNGMQPHLHIAFAGVGWEDARAKLDRAGISSNVVPFVRARDMGKFYSSLDAYVMTSRVEGGPSTVLEAMACEVPVVATRVGMMSKVVINGKNGYLVEVDDLPALVGAVKGIAADPDRARFMGRNARETVETRFTWEKSLKNLEEPYAEMAKAVTAPLSKRRDKLPNPEHLQQAVHAADAFIWAKSHIRRRRPRLASAVHLLKEMGTDPAAISRGIGLLTGAWLRAPLFRRIEEEADYDF